MYLVSLGPPSMISRHADAPVQVGHTSDQVVITLDVAHARRLAAVLALIGSSAHVDRSALTAASSEERDEWMHAVVEVLAAAALVSAAPPVHAHKVFPVRQAPRTPSPLGDRDNERTRADVSRLGPLFTLLGQSGVSVKDVKPIDWNTTIDDAGELDDSVLDGFICACGWTAINKGPDLTPTYDDDITGHLDVCQVVDTEVAARQGVLA
jgi:hypothetical protein